MKKTTALILLLACTSRDTLATSPPAPAGDVQARAQTSDGPCDVPDLVGLNRSAAEERLRRRQLALGRIDSRPADGPAGTIVDQQPKACAARPRDGRVNVVVSRGATGDAPPAGSGNGSSVGDVAVPVGIAIGAAVLGAILSRGEDEQATVPDLATLPESGVEESLRRSRLRRGEITREESLTAAAGTVIAQTPAAGTRVPPQSPVSIRVSSGRPMTEVPDLSGLDWERATALTSEARLRILPTDSQTGNLGGLIVTSQVPAAGTRVGIGAAVGVTLRAAELPAAPLPIAQQPASGPPLLADQPQLPGPGSQANPPPVTTAAPVSPPVEPAPAAASPDVPEITLAQVLQPAQPPIAPAQGVQPGAPPAFWWWPILLLLLLGVVPVASRARHYLAGDARRPQPAHATSPAVPPIAPRLTFLPRLDPGRQVMAGAGADAANFTLASNIDSGRQQLRFDTDAPEIVVEVGRDT